MYMTLTDSLLIVKEPNVDKVVEMLTDGKYGVAVIEKLDGCYVLEPNGRPFDREDGDEVDRFVRDVLVECEPNSFVCMRDDMYWYSIWWHPLHGIIENETKEHENPFNIFMSQLNTRALGIFG